MEVFKTFTQLQCGRRACQELCRPWDTEVCGSSICSSCEAHTKYTSCGNCGWQEGREAVLVGGPAHTRLDELTSIITVWKYGQVCGARRFKCWPRRSNRGPSKLS